jgi:hypothetical protein
MNFDFLKNVQLSVPETKTKAEKPGRTAVTKNPEGLALRVFSNGKIYPSQELVDKFNLDYHRKDSVLSGNGLDVFKSTDWGMFPVDAPQKYIFIAPVLKDLPKVDLFGSVKYNEDGTPVNSVMEQGGGTFGEQLLEMITEVYGITLEKGSFLDLEVKVDVVVKSPNDVYFIPKTIARGEKKGQITVVRRENITVMPLVPCVEITNILANVEEVSDEEVREQEVVESYEVSDESQKLYIDPTTEGTLTDKPFFADID